MLPPVAGVSTCVSVVEVEQDGLQDGEGVCVDQDDVVLQDGEKGGGGRQLDLCPGQVKHFLHTETPPTQEVTSQHFRVLTLRSDPPITAQHVVSLTPQFRATNPALMQSFILQRPLLQAFILRRP